MEGNPRKERKQERERECSSAHPAADLLQAKRNLIRRKAAIKSERDGSEIEREIAMNLKFNRICFNFDLSI